MGRAYICGFVRAARRWPVVLILFLGSLVAGLSFAAAAWVWLSVALGKSLATRSLLTDLNVQVFIDLFVHHGESLRMLGLAGFVLAVLFACLGVWLNAIAITAVGSEHSTPECLVRGVQLYPTFLGLWALTNVCMLGSALALVLVGRLLTRWTAESASEMTFYYVIAGSVLMGALLWLFFATVHDHARVRSRAAGAGAVRAFGWALMYVGRWRERALPLAVLLCGSSVMVWAAYQGVSHFVAADSALGVAISLLWGEILLLARMFLRVWWFAAETHLQQGSERRVPWVAAAGDRPAA